MSASLLFHISTHYNYNYGVQEATVQIPAKCLNTTNLMDSDRGGVSTIDECEFHDNLGVLVSLQGSLTCIGIVQAVTIIMGLVK